jgi:anhydro-N-acetylmuramic acid kinase
MVLMPGMPDLLDLRERLRTGRAVVAGVLSGTSGDGIDVALLRTRIQRAPDVLAFRTLPFPPDVAPRVRAALDGVALDARAIALLDRDLGRAFGAAARALAGEHGLELELVGSHGQTVWHHDGAEPSGAATLQLGDGDEVAHAAGAWTVADFRRADVAAGGGGAPLTALVEAELFPAEPRPLCVLNLGGIANLTLLGADGRLAATDAGPAGALLDGLARRLLDRPFDAGGEVAARGVPDRGLVDELARHPFFARPAPKSTGRDTFGERWIDDLLRRAGRMSAPAVLASAVELVARGVALGLGALLAPGDPRPARMLVAGGGVHHAPLTAAVARRAGLAVAPTSAAGIDPDAREAIAFALLAARAVRGVPSTDPGATGARRGAILGKICAFPPPLA